MRKSGNEFLGRCISRWYHRNFQQSNFVPHSKKFRPCLFSPLCLLAVVSFLTFYLTSTLAEIEVVLKFLPLFLEIGSGLFLFHTVSIPFFIFYKYYNIHCYICQVLFFKKMPGQIDRAKILSGGAGSDSGGS